MKKALFIIVFIFVIGMAGISIYLGDIVKKGVSSFGSQKAGVEMHLDDFSLAGIGGFKAKGLFVGNPEGFSADSAFKLGNITVRVDVASLTTDTIIIQEIRIDAPEITYEVTPMGTNLGKIGDNIAAGGDNSDESVEQNRNGGREKKVVIEDLYITNGKMTLATGIAGAGGGAPVILPDIHLEDIGKENGGSNIAETTQYILQIIVKNAASVNVEAVRGALGNMQGIGKGGIKSLKGLVKGIKLPLGN